MNLDQTKKAFANNVKGLTMANTNDNVDSVNDDQKSATEDVNETTDQDASGEDESGTVSRSAYKKLLAEAKKAKQLSRKIAEENEALRAKQLEGEANKDEKIKTLSQQLNEAKKAQKSLLGATIKKALNSQVKSEATKAGCIDSDVVMALIDLSDVEVDQDSLEADSDLLAAKIADLKKAKPHLFSKAGPRINGKMPGGQKADGNSKDELAKLSSNDLWSIIRNMDKGS